FHRRLLYQKRPTAPAMPPRPRNFGVTGHHHLAEVNRPGPLHLFLLTARSLEGLPVGNRPGSASRAPSAAPGCCPRSSRWAAPARSSRRANRPVHVVRSELALAVDADVALHEVPVLALLRLMHLRVAAAGRVLGRRRRTDDRRVDDRPGADGDAP